MAHKFLVPSKDSGGGFINPLAMDGLAMWADPESRFLGTSGSRTFDGVNQQFDLTAALAPAGDMCIWTWVNLDALPSAGNLMCIFGDAANAEGNGIFIDEDGYVTLKISDSYNTILSDTAIVVGDWTLIVINREGATGNIDLYLNGVLASEAHRTGTYAETGRNALVAAGWTITDGGAV